MNVPLSARRPPALRHVGVVIREGAWFEMSGIDAGRLIAAVSYHRRQIAVGLLEDDSGHKPWNAVHIDLSVALGRCVAVPQPTLIDVTTLHLRPDALD
jgi:hypothetical protein